MYQSSQVRACFRYGCSAAVNQYPVSQYLQSFWCFKKHSKSCMWVLYDFPNELPNSAEKDQFRTLPLSIGGRGAGRLLLGWPVVTLLTQWPHLWHLCQRIVGSYRWPHSPWENHWSGRMPVRLVHTWNSTLWIGHFTWKTRTELFRKHDRVCTTELCANSRRRNWTLLIWSMREKAMSDERSDKGGWNKGHGWKMNNGWTFWTSGLFF